MRKSLRAGFDAAALGNMNRLPRGPLVGIWNGRDENAADDARRDRVSILAQFSLLLAPMGIATLASRRRRRRRRDFAERPTPLGVRQMPRPFAGDLGASGLRLVHQIPSKLLVGMSNSMLT
ncbi:unnamed protein product [Lampetra planeri]